MVRVRHILIIIDGTRVTRKESLTPGAEYASSSREVLWDRSIEHKHHPYIHACQSKIIIIVKITHSLLRLELQIIFLVHIREPPFLRYDNLLTPWEFISSTTECLLDNWRIGIFASDGEDHLPDVDACDSTVGFTPSSTHTRLKSTYHTTSALPTLPHIEYTQRTYQLQRKTTSC